jgi:hypothetical protein
MEIAFILVCLFYSIWLGGIATTFLHRLPRKISINPQAKPRCENCKVELKMVDFFPIFGYLFNRGVCKNCGIKIPTIFLKLEITIGIVAFLMCLISGTEDINHTIISSLLVSWVVLMLFIYHQQKIIGKVELVVLLILSILYKGYHFLMPGVLPVAIPLIFIYKFYETFENKLQSEKHNIVLFTLHISTTTWFLIFPEIILFAINSFFKQRIVINPKIILIAHLLYFFIIKALSKTLNNFTANEALSWLTT